MRAVNTGNLYNIYNNSVQLYNQLPAQCYEICFHEQRGFWLETYPDIVINEKIYGVHLDKVEKVMNTYNRFTRNFGIILSGDKGIGKSLFSKLLAQRAIEQGLPVIIINTYIPGIADYINSIDQEIMCLFDEFDKVFAQDDNSKTSPQTEMLTLFDGISVGKKMFVITCNNLKDLNDYLVNRPGRFHYHFRFQYPTPEEITIYLKDKGINETEITKVIAFSQKVNLNYDCLRAIAFELADGLAFESAIADLNILHIERERFNFYIYFIDGTKISTSGSIDMFDNNEVEVNFNLNGWYDAYSVTFVPTDSIYDFDRGGNIIEGKYIETSLDIDMLESDNEKYRDLYRNYEHKIISFMQIKKVNNKELHYAL